MLFFRFHFIFLLVILLCADAQKSDSELRELVRVLRLYKVENPRTTIKIIEFGNVGMQSSGKSKFTVLIAGSYFGGSIKGGIGTRTNIIYIFKNSDTETYEVGTDLENLETVKASDITIRLTAHNNLIAAQEPGFSKQPYYVRVSGPAAIDFVIHDKPGVLPDPNNPNNQFVEEILQAGLSEEDLTPLILISPQQTLDPDYVQTTLKRIFSACGNNVHAMRKAFIMFTQLDTLGGHQLSKFVTIRDTVINEFQRQYKIALPASRIFFASLKPHMLDPHTTKTSHDSDSEHFSFDNENELVKQAKDDSKMFLPPFLKRNFGEDFEEKIKDNQLNFGLQPALDAIENEVLDYVAKNYDALVREVKADGVDLIGRAMKSLNPAHNYANVMKEVEQYVGLVSEGLAAISNTEPSHFLGALQTARNNGWPITVPKSLSLVEDIRMTLEEDRREAETTLGPISFASSAVTNRIDENSNLYQSTVSKLSGGAAVERTLSAFKFAAMSTPLPIYKPDDIFNKMAFISRGKTEHSINTGIQKMVEENMVHFPMEEVIGWTTDIYTRMLSRVLAVLDDPSVSQLLKSYPKLKVHIDNALQITYRNFFDDINKKAIADIALVKRIQFAVLGISKVESLLQLIGTSNIPSLKKMVQPADVSAGASLPPPYWAELQKFVTSMVSSATSAALQSLPDVIDTPFSFEFIGKIADCSVEDFASGGSIKLKQMGSLSDVAANQEAINDAVHAVSRLSIGITALELVELVKSTIILPAMQVDSAVRDAMTSVVQELRNASHAQLKDLLDDDATRLSSIQFEVDTITSWLSIATKLKHHVFDSSIPQLSLLKQKLEALHATEKVRLEAKAQAGTSTASPDTSSAGSDTDSETFAESAQSNCGRDRDALAIQLGNLRLEALKLKEQVKSLEKAAYAERTKLASCLASAPSPDVASEFAAAATAKAASDNARSEAETEKAAAEKARAEADAAKAAAEKAKTEAGAAKVAAEKARTEADAEKAVAAKARTEADTEKAVAAKARTEADAEKAAAAKTRTEADATKAAAAAKARTEADATKAAAEKAKTEADATKAAGGADTKTETKKTA